MPETPNSRVTRGDSISSRDRPYVIDMKDDNPDGATIPNDSALIPPPDTLNVQSSVVIIPYGSVAAAVAVEPNPEPNLDPNLEFLTFQLTLSRENELLFIQVFLNFFRDFVWTWWSCQNRNYLGDETDDADYDPRGQWMGQQVYGTVAIAAGYLCLVMLYKMKQREMPYREALIYSMAASAAIYTWDRGQTVCTAYGQNALNLSLNDAAYFSSVCTGGLEGPTQYVVITLGFMLIDPEIRKKYLYNPLRLVGEFFLSATIGAIPGGDWQIVYNADLINAVGTFDASLSVASSVAFLNAATTKINNKLIGGAENYIISRVRGYLASAQPLERELAQDTLFHHRPSTPPTGLAIRHSAVVAPLPQAMPNSQIESKR